MQLFARRESRCVLVHGEVVDEHFGKDYAPDSYLEDYITHAYETTAQHVKDHPLDPTTTDDVPGEPD